MVAVAPAGERSRLMSATVRRLRPRRHVGGPGDQGAAGGERGGVGRGLDVALLGVLPPEVDGDAGEAEQNDQARARR